MINQNQIKDKYFATIAAAKAAGRPNEVCYVAATGRVYAYIVSGAAYTADDVTVLTTANGGNTRWVSINLLSGTFTSVTISGVIYWAYAGSVLADGIITLPAITADYSAHGFVRVSAAGAISERAEFEINSTGNVSVLLAEFSGAVGAVANMVMNADTAGKFCLGTSVANPVIFKNRLAATKNVMIELWYH